jgi:hypothetical protein
MAGGSASGPPRNPVLWERGCEVGSQSHHGLRPLPRAAGQGHLSGHSDSKRARLVARDPCLHGPYEVSNAVSVVCTGPGCPSKDGTGVNCGLLRRLPSSAVLFAAVRYPPRHSEKKNADYSGLSAEEGVAASPYCLSSWAQCSSKSLYSWSRAFFFWAQ